jgi:hypothetical protein
MQIFPPDQPAPEKLCALDEICADAVPAMNRQATTAKPANFLNISKLLLKTSFAL